jgi:hypothetical protein
MISADTGGNASKWWANGVRFVSRERIDATERLVGDGVPASERSKARRRRCRWAERDRIPMRDDQEVHGRISSVRSRAERA